jgi:hypothetical protein
VDGLTGSFVEGSGAGVVPGAGDGPKKVNIE